jgi:hypothetical protein
MAEHGYGPEYDFSDIEGQTAMLGLPQLLGMLKGGFSKKAAIKLGLANKRITGIARISEIIDYKQNEKEMGFAVYEWYKKFPKPLTFDQIGGDYRTNINNSMNKVDEDKKFLLISSLLKYL